MSEEHRNEPRFFSLLWNAKPQTWRSLHSRVYVPAYPVIQISQLQFVITILNLLFCELGSASNPSQECLIQDNLANVVQVPILATRDTQFGQELALVMQTTHAQR